jgi:hypothetical protein
VSKVKIEIKSIWGSVIFTREAVGNNLERTLRAAIKEGANLRSADLRYANLSSADLRYANLSSADLRYANLRSADLSSANLRYANLRSADLSSANLRSADLSSANLSSADLSEVIGGELAIAKTRILPEGSIIGWKKCRDGVIVKLRIPEEAKRSHAFDRKCRAEYVEVLEVIGGKIGISTHDGITEYEVGKTVKCDKFDNDWMQECSGGIHFFITLEEAKAYC